MRAGGGVRDLVEREAEAPGVSADGRPAFVVSMHDVSPLTREVFTAMLADLRSLGLTKCSLLVIPDHHHRVHFLSDAPFCRWLERLASEGHELVVHGYYHQREARASESWAQRLVTRVYTLGEGEFYDLPKAEAGRLLALACEEFRRLDAPAPTGFVAPAWLLGEEAAAAVREAGFRYTTRLRGFEDFARGGYVGSQSLVYSCRNTWRRNASLVWNGGLVRGLGGNPIIRLGLHPPDFRYRRVWEQIRQIVREQVREREVMTYGEFAEL